MNAPRRPADWREPMRRQPTVRLTPDRFDETGAAGGPLTVTRPSATPLRILMIPVGTAGDVYPYVAIGLALQRRGHEVSVLANAYFGPLLSRVGLSCIPVGTVDDYLRAVEHPDFWHPRRALAGVGEAIRPQVTEIARVLRELTSADPPLLVAHPLAVGARVAQEALGFPLVTLHVESSGFLSEHNPAVPHVWLASVTRWPRLARRLLVALGDRRAGVPGGDAEPRGGRRAQAARAHARPPKQRISGCSACARCHRPSWSRRTASGPHCRWRDSRGSPAPTPPCCDRACTPVRGVARHRFQGGGHHALDVRVRDRPRRAGASFIQQAVTTGLEKPAAPLADGHPRRAQLGGHRQIAP